MAAGGWFDWTTGDLVTESRFQDIQDSLVFIFASESAANSALTNKVEGTVFYDTTANLLKAWSGSAWISAETGDIEGVTAGTGLSGGGTTGTVTVNFDPNSLSAGTVSVANDSIAIIDADDSGNPKKESIVDLVAGIAGTNLTASSGQLNATAGGASVGLILALG
jgi:trimeric autotransporter adhesin